MFSSYSRRGGGHVYLNHCKIGHSKSSCDSSQKLSPQGMWPHKHKESFISETRFKSRRGGRGGAVIAFNLCYIKTSPS